MFLPFALFLSHYLTLFMYKSCSESNASYFITLPHNIGGRCWWYGNRGWTFPSTFHYILLPYDRRQQRGSVTEWHLTWKCIGSKGRSFNFSMSNKQHPSTFINSCWTFLENKQWMWAQWGCGWCISVTTPSHQLWSCGSCVLMQIFANVLCSHLHSSTLSECLWRPNSENGENAQLMVVTMLKNSVS